MDLLEDLMWRGLVHTSTDLARLRRDLDRGLSLYCGFDPTADSLHVGSLLPLVTLARFHAAGHRSIAVVGGATALIGDPSGKSGERSLVDPITVAGRTAAISAQLRALGVEQVCDNNAWFAGMSAIELLRDVGKHFPVSDMLERDSVSSRLHSGLSFTEFAYQLLQARDFAQLCEKENVTLQIGGSDQWGNITAGASLIRRTLGREVHGLTVPLLVDRHGAKMGKTADGAMWLDAARTTPLQLFQFLLNVDDAEVIRMLQWLTFLSVHEIDLLQQQTVQAPQRRTAQRRLAEEVVRFVHGDAAVAACSTATAALFGSASSAEQLLAVQEMPRTRVPFPADLVDVLVATGLCTGRNDARRLITNGGARVNGVKVNAGSVLTDADLIDGQVVQISNGKRRHALVLPT